MRSIALGLGLVLLMAPTCRRSSPLSTEEVIGEWRKTDGKLPPVSLLVSAEGVGLRARLRLSGAESTANARLSGTELMLDFDDARPDATGVFVSKAELDLRFGPNGPMFRLHKRP